MLERRLSSGSMTDRIGTFREQSPNRGAARPAARDAPPVPSIPASYSPVLGHGRSSSLQPAMRISSPAPSSAGRGSSLQPARRQSIRRNQAPPGPERTDSRGSVNFSYPTSLQRRISDDDDIDRGLERLLTPVRPAIDLEEMVYDSNTRSFRSRGDLLLYEQRLRDAVQSPQRKRSVRKEGSHLAQGSVGGRMKVSAHAMEPRRPVDQPQQQEEEHILPRTLRQHAPATDPATDVSAREDRLPQQVSPRKQRQTSSGTRPRSNTASDNDSDASEKRQKTNRKTLTHQPSVVREVSEPEDTEDRGEKVLGSQAALRHAGHRDIQETVESQTPTPATRKQQAPVETPVVIPKTTQPKTAPQKSEKMSIPQDDTHDSKPETESAKPTTTQEEPVRGTSFSPGRQAGPQFLSPTGTVGSLRHNPSRSISPMKSALKHTSSRGPSPLGENPEGWTAGHGSADLSDASTSMSESKPMRKKSVRVSFDEGSNVVVTDPELEQAGMRSIWSRGQHNFRNRSNSPMSEESEGMGPRPSLPVFGSVRKEKKYVLDDRPLVVKPYETSNASSIDMGSEKSSNYEKKTFGPSSDHMVGAILAQDFSGNPATANESDTSKSREPLPPIVSPREDSGFQSGYHSSNESDDSDSQENAKIEEAVVVEIPEAEREALRTPEGHRKPRFIEDLSSESETPTKEKAPVLFTPDNNGGSAPGSRRTPSTEGDTPLFTPPEDEDMLRLTKKAAADSIAHGMPPNLVVTVPTPIAEQEEWQPSMPGGLTSWDSPTSTPTLEEQREISLDQYMVTQDSTPAAVGIAEPEVVTHARGAPVVGEIAAQAEEILTGEQSGRRRSASAASNRTEDESVYSDAAEHLTDTEGDGFMSLDAVVDSPVSPKIEERFVAPAPHSPTRTTQSPATAAAQAQKEEADGDWIRTQRYWASLSDEKKKQLEEEARRLAESEASATEDETISTKRHNQKSVQKQREPAAREKVRMPPPPKMAPLQAQEETKGRRSPDRTYQIQPGSKAAPPPPNGVPSAPPVAMASTMRHSLRNPQPEVLESGRMRASLRVPPPAQVRPRPASSSQYQAPAQNYYRAGTGSLNANSRYSHQPAAQAPTPAPAPAKPTPREQAIALVQAQQIAMHRMEEEKRVQKPALRRRGSNDSDSSFKRARSGGNGFFSRTSMRGEQVGHRAASVGGPPQSDRGRKFSVRSLSPVGRRGMGGAVQSTSAGAVLTTLRGSRPAAQRMMTPPTGETPKSSGFFGRKKAKSATSSAGFGKSRFANSDSDEDTPRPQAFRSRFADTDSDDDEPPASMPPISMQNRSFRTKGATAPNSKRPQSDVELDASVGFGSMRPPNPRKPSRVLEEDSSDLEDIDDEETREKTRLNSIQGVEARAAAKGVHPEAIRLAQAYFGSGLLNTSEKYEGTGTSTQNSTPVRQRNVTPPGESVAGTSQTSLSPGKTSVPSPNFHQDKKSPERKKKGGLMSILSRKRKDKNDKVGKRAVEDSGARQGTPLERSRLDLEAARMLEDPPTPGSMAGPGGSKLRKKGFPQLERPEYGRAASGSFNVQVSRSSEIALRPATSDGLGQALKPGPRDGLGDDSLFGRGAIHEKSAGVIDIVTNDHLPMPTHERTNGPTDGMNNDPLPHPSHETTSGPIDGVAIGRERPGVLRRGTSASAVNFEGKKREKKKGFLRRMFDL